MHERTQAIAPNSSLSSETVLGPVVLNLWVMTPLGVSDQISCILDIYIMIHNSSKITVMKQQ